MFIALILSHFKQSADDTAGNHCCLLGFSCAGIALAHKPLCIRSKLAASCSLSYISTTMSDAVLGYIHIPSIPLGKTFTLQGRVSASFDDRNEQLLTTLTQQYPNALSLEMETFHLLDLARCSGGKIKAAAVAIALAERYTNDFIAASEIEKLEKQAGLAALTTLTEYKLAGNTHTAEALHANS